MSEPFTPEKKEEFTLVKISKREAVLLQKLRKYPFGKFTVHKTSGLIIRIEILNSELIEEDAPIDNG